MPSNTTYNPPNIGSLVKNALLFNGQSIQATVTAGQSANLDLLLCDDHLITGIWPIINNGNYGDNIKIQVVDTTGFTGQPAGTVLQQLCSFYVPPTMSTQFDLLYPAKAISGLTLRIVYNSTGSSDVFVAINYKLHKVLV